MAAKDITKSDALANVYENDEGTGIYWFIDPAGRYEQVFVPSITRRRADELAGDFGQAGKQTLDAYRWVPDQIENAQSLVSKQCSGTCRTDLDCIDNACRCISGHCQRK